MNEPPTNLEDPVDLYCMRCCAKKEDQTVWGGKGPKTCTEECAGWPVIGCIQPPLHWKPFVEQAEKLWPGIVAAHERRDDVFKFGKFRLSLEPMHAISAAPEVEHATLKGALLSDIARILGQDANPSPEAA